MGVAEACYSVNLEVSEDRQLGEKTAETFNLRAVYIRAIPLSKVARDPKGRVLGRVAGAAGGTYLAA